MALGALLVANMVHAFLDKKTIPVSYDQIFDPKSRLKEIYDKYHWGFSVRNKGAHGAFIASMVVSRDPNNGSSNVEVYGYPGGAQGKTPGNRRLLCTSRGPSKEGAQQNAAKQALEVLRTQYNIQEDRSSPN